MNKYCIPRSRGRLRESMEVRGCAIAPQGHVEYYASLEVYDDNYERLMVLLPALRQASLRCRLEFAGCDGFGCQLLEKTPYTSVVCLTADWSVCSKLVPTAEMTVRLYHDAAVAEVLAYQNHSRFKVEYDYPNPNMFNKREKRRLNEFLGEWLVCISRHHFTAKAQ